MQIPFRGILFDNDGVLVDSHAAARLAWDTWALEHGVVGLDIAQHSGRRAQEIVLEFVGEELFESANDRINELEQLSAHQTLALPGAKELVLSLVEGSWTICTSANPRLGRARIEAAGIPVPKELVTAADVNRGKPAPDPYLLGAARLGFDPIDCVVFEDALAGVISAKEAGVGFVVGVSSSATDTEADIVVSSLEGVRHLDGALVIDDWARIR